MKVQLTEEQITALKQQVDDRVKELRKGQDGQGFRANTKKHYKIWFSKDPNIFLPFINQMRLIKMKQNVKAGTEIRLVYSGDLLSEKAKRDMQKFCTDHGVIPINFDTIETKKGHDKEIKDLIKIELQKATENKGGDLAAASDLARIMIALAETCGIYSDFDFIFTDKIKTIEDTVLLEAPIALRYEFTKEGDERGSNNIIVPTTTKGSGKNLTEECLNALKAAQEASIKISKQPIIVSLLHTPSGDNRELFKNSLTSTFLRPMLLEFLNRNKEDQSIHNFRSFIKNFDYKMLLSVLFQDNKTQYEKIQIISEEDAFNMFAMWITVPGNVGKIDYKTNVSTIVHAGLAYILRNGAKLDGDIKLKMQDETPGIEISKSKLNDEIFERRFDIAKILMRAIKDSIYIPTVTCITGPELHCNILIKEYIKPKKTQTRTDEFVEIISLKILHNLDKIFTNEHFKNGDMQGYFLQRVNSTKSFSEAISNVFKLNSSSTDVYWTEEGKRNMDEYVAEMENAATKIKKWYGKHQKSWSERVSGQTSNDISK